MSLLSLFAAAILASSAPVFVEKPCADARLAKLARCGTVTVPEDRANPAGRTLSLNIIILSATGPAPHLPPLFDIDGGPGLPVTKNAEFYASLGAAYRERRDVILVDQRGTGGSNPLHCPELANPEAAYSPLYPAGAVARCRKALEVRADLTRYGTREAVADLDAVRRALGHDRIDMFGLSYGTTVALRYMAEHPTHVRAAVLMGVTPANALPPRRHAPAGQRALDLLFAQCSSDTACGDAFKPAGDFDRALTRLPDIDNAPSAEIFAEKLRSLMYQPSSARRLPYILSRAAEGDLEPFFSATRPKGPQIFAEGMFLSVVCSETMPFIDYEAAAEASRATVFGDYRLRRQREACAEWPKAAVSPEHLKPVVSDVPVLLISGELDPVTPPAWAEEVAKYLPNNRHIIIPSSGHIFDGLSAIDTCFDPLVVKFLDTGNARAIDAGCLARMRPPPFTIADEPRQN